MIVVFKLAELVLRGVNRLRRALYRAGVLRAKRLPRPVISIGNIALGGSGKTPLVIRVARHLTGQGMRVGVLTRGYGREGTRTGVVDRLDAVSFGDEPVLIKMSIDNGDVIVGKYRYNNATEYLSSQLCDVFLLDDGFQHLQIAREADIVIDNPAATYLREGRSALRDADILLVRGRDFDLRLQGTDALHGRRVFAFAGLADNAQFFNALRGAGLELVGTREFPDHHRYTEADLEAIRTAAGITQAEFIVTTEKDAVKFRGARDIIPIAAEVVIEREEEFFRRLMALIGR